MALCVHRNGPRRVNDLNQHIIYQLEASNAVPAGVKAYPGIPLTVAGNDAALGLFNGALGFGFRTEVRLTSWSLCF